MLKIRARRYVSLALAIVLIFSLSTTTFAVDNNLNATIESQNEVYLVNNGHGQYSISANAKGDTILAKITEIDGLYQFEDKSLVYETMDGIYLAVDKIDINLDNATNELLAAKSQYTLPKEVSEGLERRIEILEEYSKNETESTSNNVLSLIAPKSVSSKSTSTNYYTYNGYNMKDYIIYVPSASTGYFDVAEHSSTQNAANAITSLIIIGGGLSNTTLSLFAAGISAFQVFLNWANVNSITGHTNDFLQCKITYANWDKWTYGKIGNDWHLGCVSQRTYVKEVKTLQHYVNNSSNPEYLKVSYPKYTRKSNNFTNSAAKAIYCLYNPWTDEAIRAKYYNKTIYF